MSSLAPDGGRLAVASGDTAVAALLSLAQKGTLQIAGSADGHTCALLSESSAHAGAGMFTLTDSGGAPAVEGGFDGSAGVVRAQPMGLQGLFGTAPESWIRGSSGGGQ